jgi:hypothetical protein
VLAAPARELILGRLALSEGVEALEVCGGLERVGDVGAGGLDSGELGLELANAGLDLRGLLGADAEVPRLAERLDRGADRVGFLARATGECTRLLERVVDLLAPEPDAPRLQLDARGGVVLRVLEALDVPGVRAALERLGRALVVRARVGGPPDRLVEVGGLLLLVLLELVGRVVGDERARPSRRRPLRCGR